MFFFHWIRERVKAAIMGGFADAADALEMTEPDLRERLEPAKKALPAADDEPAKGKKKQAA